MKGNVEILDSGLLTTIQDGGRYGFAKFGVPIGGAMDLFSFSYANSLLGNDQNDACLEWTLQPPVLKFTRPTSICLTGGIIDASLNDNEVAMHKRIEVRKNDILRLNFCKKGVYGYVGIKGGFLTDTKFNSRSFFKSITDTCILMKGDVISYVSAIEHNDNYASVAIKSSMDDSNVLKVYKGPEFDLLSKDQISILLNSPFTISNLLNRMAIQLKEKFVNNLTPILTSPVLPGTIQLTPAGNIIVLMRDCQTTGGYPRILQLNEKAMNCIAQKRMEERIMFSLITE